MQKVHLKCFSFRPKGGNPCSHLRDGALQFCSSLSEDLKKLEQSLAKGSVSLRWSTEAMNLLKKMQVEFLKLVDRSELPFSGGCDNWLEEYMEATIKLLDFCNLLKKAISRVERYQMVVHFSIRKLQNDTSVATNITEIERLETERKMLLNAQNWGDVILDKCVPEYRTYKKGINSVLFAFKGTMIIVILFLVSAIVSPVSVDMGKDVGLEFHQQGPFATSLLTLNYQFRERIMRPEGRPTLDLVEKKMVEKAVADLKAHVAEGTVEDRKKLLKSVDMLKKRSDDLKEGLEMFDSAANEVFEEVIKGRKKILEIYSSSAMTS